MPNVPSGLQPHRTTVWVARAALEFGRGRAALFFSLRGAEFERKMCMRCSTIGTNIGAVVTELSAPLSAISALRRRDVFARDTNWRRSTSGGDDRGRQGGVASGRRPWRTLRASSVRFC